MLRLICVELDKKGHSMLMELFAYHGLSLYILVTGLGHTRRLLKRFDIIM